MWIKTLKDLILGTLTSDCIIYVPIHQFPSSVVRFPDQILFFRDENWVWGFEEHLLAEKDTNPLKIKYKFQCNCLFLI